MCAGTHGLHHWQAIPLELSLGNTSLGQIDNRITSLLEGEKGPRGTEEGQEIKEDGLDP